MAQAREAAPSILLLDELDALGASRATAEGGNSVAERALSTLLNEMDGVGHQKQAAVRGPQPRFSDLAFEVACVTYILPLWDTRCGILR